MQVFLTYPDFRKSVEVLDPSRLGNQIYRECLTLIRGGWKNHPCSKMWISYKHALALYALCGLDELEKRGRIYPHHRKTFLDILNNTEDNGMPSWLGDKRLHLSHQSNLIRKKPEYYSKFWPNVPNNLEYFWPTKNGY